MISGIFEGAVALFIGIVGGIYIIGQLKSNAERNAADIEAIKTMMHEYQEDMKNLISKNLKDVKDLIDTNKIILKGEHNYENIMAVISAVKVYNVDNDSICKVLKTFGGVEHRIEYVTTLDGVDYYNDSKATNCESTKIALKSFNQPTLLILGGLDRGHSFDDLTPCMENVSFVACYGETKERIKEYCDRINYKFLGE